MSLPFRAWRLQAVGNMACDLNVLEIAARLRGLLGLHGLQNLDGTAYRLCVPEVELRMAVDEVASEPAMSVLAAVVREYGVDPSWLLFGAYDLTTHQAAIDTGEYATPVSLLKLATRRAQEPTMPPHDLRLPDASLERRRKTDRPRVEAHP